MNYSVGVEYALHTLIYLVDLEPKKTIGIKALASIHELSPTYLSKIYTKLKKKQIVLSTPGANGGYRLAKEAKDISFLDVIHAVEGDEMFFQCLEIRCQNTIVKSEVPAFTSSCLIKKIMDEAQQPMVDFLKEQTLRQLYDDATASFTKEKQDAIASWIEANQK